MKRIAMILMFLCFSATAWAAGNARECSRAVRDISGGAFPGNWKALSVECFTDDTIRYVFKNETRQVQVDAMPHDPKRPAFLHGKQFDLSFRLEAAKGDTPPEVEQLLTALAPRLEALERVSGEAASGKQARASEKSRERLAFFVSLLALVVAALLYAALMFATEKTRFRFLVWTCRTFAMLIFVLALTEFALRVFGIAPADKGMVRFVGRVRSALDAGGEARENLFSEPHVRNTQNYLGFRDGIHPYEADVGVFRIAFVGDSFMQGEGVEPWDTFPAKFHKRLQAAAAGLDMEIMNFGTSGSDTYDEAALLLYEIPAYHPDFIVWGYTLNDIVTPQNRGNNSAAYDGVRLNVPRFEEMVLRHDLGGVRKYWRMYDIIVTRHENAALTRATLGYYQDAYSREHNTPGLSRMRKDFDRVAEFYRRRGVPIVFFIYPLFVDLDENYPFEPAHRTVAASARAAGMDVVDTLPRYLGQDASALWVSPQNHHPNARGQKIAADTVAKHVVARRVSEPGLLRKHKWKSVYTRGISVEERMAGAGKMLSNGLGEDALDEIAPVLELYPDNPAAQYLAARAMAESSMIFSLIPKYRRLINAGPPWSRRAEAIIRDVRKKGVTVPY